MEINLYNLRPSTMIEMAQDLDVAINSSSITKIDRARQVLAFRELVEYLEMSHDIKDLQGLDTVTYTV